MKYLKKKYQGLNPYHSSFIEDGIILNANENPFNENKALMEHMKKAIENININRYPDTDATKLKKAIATAYNVDIECITCGVGSDELLNALINSTVEDDDYVLALNPTFSMYKEFTILNSGKYIDVALNDDFTYNVEEIIKVIKEKNPKVTFLCNPNNPTGSYVDIASIERICKATNNIIVVDEAYEEFYNNSAIKILDKYNNLAVFKTFSKAYGLAGARCGYAIASRDIINCIDCAKAPYNLNSYTIEAATFVMQNKNLYQENINLLIEYRDKLYNDLKALGIKVWPSKANFLFLKFEDEVFNHLLNNKIYIRKLFINNTNYYRISIGTKEENEKLINCLKEVL